MRWSALLLLFGLSCVPPPGPARPHDRRAAARAFDFLPATERAVRERSETHLRVIRDGLTTERLTSLSLRSTLHLRRDGYLIRQEVEEVTAQENGLPVAVALGPLLLQHPLEWLLSKDGAFVKLLGPRSLDEETVKRLPDLAAQAIAREAFAFERLEREARVEWTARFGALLGRPVAKGARRYFVERLPGGTPVLVESTFEGAEDSPHGTALRFSWRCASEWKAGTPAGEAYQAAGEPALAVPARCEGTQLIGERPFLPLLRVLELELPDDGNGKMVVRTQTRFIALEGTDG